MKKSLEIFERVLEKDGDNHLDRSCENRRSISYSPREKEGRKAI